MTGVDPAGGSLAVAHAKPGAERVRWVHGDATTLPPMQASTDECLYVTQQPSASRSRREHR